MINSKMNDKSFWQAALTIPKNISRDMEVFMIKAGALGFHELLYAEGITENLHNDNTIHYYYFSPDFPAKAFVPMVLGIFECPDSEYEIKQVFYEEFLKTMEETFTPFMATPRIWIVPPWKTDHSVEEKKLIINPAFAFGTGRHATTRLMLEVMEQMDFQGKKVLEMGCGSGILSIASIMMGASHVVGVDVESLSVESSMENFLANREYHNFKSMAEFHEGDFSWLQKNPDYKFQIFLSNILPEIFYQNESDFLKFLHASQTWIISGIVEEKEEEFYNWIIELSGESTIHRMKKEDWVVFYK